jgi:hypothetical protein
VVEHSWTIQLYDTDGPDADGDGVPDAVEERLVELAGELGLLAPDPNVPDGELDSDRDGLSNAAEIAFGRDPARADTDGDGIPDGEEDEDLDLLPDAAEFAAGTDPRDFDSDDDGWADGDEVVAGSDPNDPASGPPTGPARARPVGVFAGESPRPSVGVFVGESPRAPTLGVEVP